MDDSGIILLVFRLHSLEPQRYRVLPSDCHDDDIPAFPHVVMLVSLKIINSIWASVRNLTFSFLRLSMALLLFSIQLLLLLLQCSAEDANSTSSTVIASPTASSPSDSDSRHLKFIIIGLFCGAAVLSLVVAILLSVCCRASKRGISNGEDTMMTNKILDKWEGVHTNSKDPEKISRTTSEDTL
ncbi:hypothetical protein IW261DRAFT_784900 [Armillaria novae-zelandiae]|uniref:Uncharacterized protein n=1 Tax=Armillaria novae-zelandiae TaxID=153914 RepID=A0AA39PN42_9AGAR|nr:hypothetical protein IW261DRAFT_784900 [Armillaria novae-zelandiae]